MIKTNTIIQHDVTKDFPLPDGCIDVVITSPPYWGLRDYGVDGQIGLESHPQEYIDKLVGVAREIKRVLKKSGSFYLNLGDTYFGGGGSSGHTEETKNLGRKTSSYNPTAGHTLKLSRTNWMQPKQLMLIPVRVAIALQDDGWVLRNDIIWHKPNPMPSSVKDRLNNTFEHVFHFVKSRKYYYDLDAIREPHKSELHSPGNKNRVPLTHHFDEPDRVWGSSNGKNPGDIYRNKPVKTVKGMRQAPEPNEPNAFHIAGKNPGDVIVPSSWGVDKNQEYHGDGKHNPKGQSPSDLKKSIVESYKNNPKGCNPGDFWDITTQPFTSYSRDLEHFAVFPKELIVKPLKASCPSGGVVLDPFCGRGTVGRVAKELGLNYVLFDISKDYCELARLYVNGQKRKLIKNQGRLET